MAPRESPSASALAWLKARSGVWFGSVFAFTFACAQFAYSIVMHDPNDQKWFWVSLLALLALAAIAWRLAKEREFRLDSLDALLAALFLYSALSLAWSPDPRAGLLFLAKGAAVAAVFIYLKDFGDELLFRRLVAWITVAAAVVLWLAYTQPGAWGGFHNQNFITEYLVLALPFCLAYIAIAASRARRATAVLVVLGISWYLVVDNPSRLEFLIVPLVAACAAGLVCARRWGKWPIFAIGALLALGLAVATAAFWEAFPYSERGLRHSILPRVALVVDTFSMWLGAPLLGHGAGSFQYLFPAYQEDHAHRFGIDVVLLGGKHLVAGAAHNEYLQLLSTLGLAGAGLAAAFLWRCIRIARSGAEFGPVQYAALGAILVWSVNAAVEFPLQNPATLVLAAASVAFLVSNPYRRQVDTLRVSAGPRVIALAATLMVLSAVGLQVLCDRLTDASKLYRSAIYFMGIGDARNAYLALREAYLSNPWDTQTRSALFLNAVILMEAESWSAATPAERVRAKPFLSGHIDALYDKAVSAGRQPGVLQSRLYYLVRSGNFPSYRAEIDASLQFMRKNAANIHDTWRMDALYGAFFGDLRQIDSARDGAARNGMPPDQLAQLAALEKLVREYAGNTSRAQNAVIESNLPAPPKVITRRIDPPI